ncbi:MAG: hypothetical protein N3A02_04255 [Rectinema sp.]|nr:hypothetical protein [Rectinema sp.]
MHRSSSHRTPVRPAPRVFHDALHAEPHPDAGEALPKLDGRETPERTAVATAEGETRMTRRPVLVEYAPSDAYRATAQRCAQLLGISHC